MALVNPVAVFGSIDAGGCLPMPDHTVKQLAGNEWGSYLPADGDQGVIFWMSSSCSSPNLTVFIVKMDNSQYVAVGAYSTRTISVR